MLYSSKNQIGNASNPFQGKDTKVLCLCSAGLLRSPTIADVLTKAGGYNCRAAGMSEEYALIPVSTALLAWADRIVVVKEQADRLERALDELNISQHVTVLDIPDNYERNNPELVAIVTELLLQEGFL
jgi:predicted protein tyrosine phosphatase